MPFLRIASTPPLPVSSGGSRGLRTSLLSGELGRCITPPLIRRQYKQRAFQLADELRRNLIRRYSALGDLPLRQTPLARLKPVGAHADAQGYGHIAAVLLGRFPVTVSHRLPAWFCVMAENADVESGVYHYDLCAAINERDEQTPRTCVLCVDNQAAVAALAKGSSSSALGAIVFNLFWNVAARGNTRWWVEYVHAKSNSADLPSRWCTIPERAECTAPDGRAPAISSETFESWRNLHLEAALF